jgi:hypothetical protein
MAENPMLNYKPGLTMDTPVTVTMAAADWAILLAWHGHIPDEIENGVRHIVYGIIAEQISAALYTPASVQAAKAKFYDDRDRHATIILGGVPHETLFPEVDDEE